MRPRLTGICLAMVSAVVPVTGSASWVLPAGQAADRGVAWLAETQQADGTWPYYETLTPDFSVTSEQPRIFPTMLVLLNLGRTRHAAHPLTGPAAAYVLGQIETEEYLWAVDGRDELMHWSYARLPCFLDPDSDDSAVGLTLFGDRLGLGPGDYLRIREIFDRYRHEPSGLYFTYFTGFDHGTESCSGNRPGIPSVGMNLHVLMFFERAGLEHHRLQRDLAMQIFGPDSYWQTDEYYYSRQIQAAIASAAVEYGGSAALPFLRRLVHGQDDRPGPVTLARLTAIELAGEIKARAVLCRTERRACACPVVDHFARELIGRQQDDGGWPAAPWYRAAGRLYGSPAETTAFAAKALMLYEEARTRVPADPADCRPAPKIGHHGIGRATGFMKGGVR